VAACHVGNALDAGDYELVAHLRQKQLPELERRFWEVADPDGPQYLKHMSVDEIAAIIGASDEEVRQVTEWLVSLGATRSSIHVSSLRDSITATVASAGKVEATSADSMWSFVSQQKPSAVEFVVRHDVRSEADQKKIEKPRLKDDVGSQYTISNIKEAYGMSTKLQALNESTLQMVWGPGTFGYSKMQLSMHKATQCPLLNMNKVKFDTENHGEAGGDNYGEGNLDVQMITSFGLNVETLVSNTNTSASTEEGSGFGQALLDFITELSTRKTVPQVLSMSLGSLSAASCDLLCTQASKMGHSLKECQEYLQQQRQVCMFLSTDQQNRINTAFQVLGVRGVSIFGSSGDGGSHFSFGGFHGGPLADTLNKISCNYQMPVFPTTSPYIVSVGGTMWEGSSKNPITWAGFGGGSGSGFSWEFAMPEHQKAAVSGYLGNTSGLPPAASFFQKGRAYPDISAIAVDGTSQSCPIMAGIFSMINDARLNAGLPPLGFAAPRIWKLAQQFPGEVFEDVSKGNSRTSCDNGFPSVANGWDPNTGWGRPIWTGMMKHLASDSGKQSSIVV
jgi:tripeptidyl-peptidase-1